MLLMIVFDCISVMGLKGPYFFNLQKAAALLLNYI